MLLQLRDYIDHAGVVSTQQLARAFHMDTTALQPMLDIWLKKGVIRQCEETTSCQRRCFRCKPSTPVFYQFVRK